MNQSLADTTAVQEAVKRRQVYIEAEETLLTEDSPTLSLVAPIKDDQGVVRGVLIADMPTLPSDNGFSLFLRRQGGGYDLELVTGSGLVLASSIPGRAIKESLHWEIIRQLAQERQSGIEEHTLSGEMETHLVAFAPLAQVPWAVVLVQPEEKALELPWMGRRPFMVSGLVVLLAAGLMWIVTRQIVSPLQRLAATAQRFGSGDLEVQVPAMGQDEIGQLAESLDTMRHQLKHSLDEINQWNQELEQRVKQRTNELEELDQQLRERDKERSDLLEKIITAQEEERRRIARELHDEVSQTLTGLVMSLGSAEALLRRAPAVKQRLQALRSLTSEAVEEVRRLIQDLRPSLLDDLGLVAAIGWYVENHLAPAGVKAELETQGFDRRLPPTVEITLFRVVQEAITNIIKHAQAKTAYIRLQFTHSAIEGSIKDDGVGFNADTLRPERRRGMAVGLLGMEERISLLEGKLNIESQPGGGTHVHFEIPWQDSSSEENSRSDS
jgi:signal transduction histidine kinase